MSDGLPDYSEEAQRLLAERRAAWEALPPLSRIETWYDTTRGWSIGFAFEALGEALRDWAKEQQK